VVKASFGLAALLLVVLAQPCGAADPNALWQIVGGQCVPGEQQHESPKPCALVDLAGGFAVLKDIVGDTQFLLIPTTRVTGIESPEILAQGAPNYFEAAWQARHFVDERAHRDLPRDDLSLVINAENRRSQNQLHIHVDCVRLDVQTALREHAGAVGASWAPFPTKLVDHDYMAMRIDQSDLTHANPFLLLADGIPGARDDMGTFTLAVVGQPSGFVVLAGHGWGEALQDHACAVAH
jgi:CDP-diacylglycerol pyrophosphatase